MAKICWKVTYNKNKRQYIKYVMADSMLKAHALMTSKLNPPESFVFSVTKATRRSAAVRPTTRSR